MTRTTTRGGLPRDECPECDDDRPTHGGIKADVGACCWECSVRGELEEATIFDTSGGAYLQLCRWCRDIFERRGDIYQPTVCVRCRRHSDPSRAEGLQFFDAGGGAGALHVCDECRLELLGMAVDGNGPLGDRLKEGVAAEGNR